MFLCIGGNSCCGQDCRCCGNLHLLLVTLSMVLAISQEELAGMLGMVLQNHAIQEMLLVDVCLLLDCSTFTYLS